MDVIDFADNLEDALEILEGLRQLLAAAACGAGDEPLGAAAAALVAERIGAACELMGPPR